MALEVVNCGARIAPAEALPAIVAAVSGLQYGQVTVIVHDGQVVQIERTERQRLLQTENHSRKPEPTGRAP